MRQSLQITVRVFAIFLVILIVGQAQSSRPTFEVASVKPATKIGPIDSRPNGRFMAAGQTLKVLIGYAYRMRNFQVIGGPAWINKDLWQIEAKAEEGTVVPRPILGAMKPDVIALMLQSLLEERFQLKLHEETRELPLYELVPAKGGHKMRLSEDQTPLNAGQQTSPPPPHLPAGLPALTRGSYSISRNPSGMKFEAKAIAMDTFINVLTNETGRKIIDRVGLTGLYDIKLEWIPDTLQGPVEAVRDGLEIAANPSGPLLTTAIEVQLGLRLVSAKGPVEVVVIDSVQKPSEN